MPRRITCANCDKLIPIGERYFDIQMNIKVDQEEDVQIQGIYDDFCRKCLLDGSAIKNLLKEEKKNV